MSNSNYNQRLKQIRQKYGSSMKQSPTFGNSYSINMESFNVNNRQVIHPASGRTKSDFNNRPQRKQRLQNDYTDSMRNQIKLNTMKNSEDTTALLKTKTRQQRLRQIEQIRQSYAQSRNKTIQDWTKNCEKSRRRFDIQHNDSFGLRERVNQLPIRNPQFQEKIIKQNFEKCQMRNRAQSSYCRKNQDLLNQMNLKRNYEYSKQNCPQKYFQLSKNVKSFKDNYDNFDKQNAKRSFMKEFDFSRNLKIQESQNTSPIRGLMKFDSVQKSRTTNFNEKTFNLANIDRIQQRIQQILNSK